VVTSDTVKGAQVKDQDDEPQEVEKPAEQFKYNVKLDGHRGSTVMKFTEEEAAVHGLTDADKVDSKPVEYPQPEGVEDGTEEAEETPATPAKKKAPANKSRTSPDK
jgi:hypothetical protein